MNAAMKARLKKVTHPKHLLACLIAVAIVAGIGNYMNPKASRRELALGAAVGVLLSMASDVFLRRRTR